MGDYFFAGGDKYGCIRPKSVISVMNALNQRSPAEPKVPAAREGKAKGKQRESKGKLLNEVGETVCHRR